MILIEIIAIPLIMLFLGSLLGYWLGHRSQRIQAKKKYVAEIVREKYPALSSEINQNISIFEDYLEDPREHFDFPLLSQFYNDGFSKFMNEHHPDLFVSIDYLDKKIALRLYELHQIVGKTINGISDIWMSELHRILPSGVKRMTIVIVPNLIRIVNRNNVFEDLLNDRKDEIGRKVKAVISENTTHISPARALDYDKILNSLLKTAKPEISRILGLYSELQQQVNEKMKLELLPLLHLYISNPYK